MSAYPQNFEALSPDERNAWFAAEARAYRERKNRPALRLASMSDGLDEPPPAAPLDQLPGEYGWGVSDHTRPPQDNGAEDATDELPKLPKGGFVGFVGSPDGHKAKKNEQKWDEPRPIESALPPVMAFDARLLPSSLGDYVLDAADRQQAPPDFAAVSALVGLAAVAGNRVRMRPKQLDDWTVVPNLWGAAIGAPSMMKTPAIRSALGPVFDLQNQLKKTWEVERQDATIDAELSELESKAAAKKAQSAFRAGDIEEAKRLLSERSSRNDVDIPCPRLIVNDATVEKLGELLNQNPRGLLLIRDELPGFLAKMESEEFQSDRAFYLEAFNGDGQFTYDRIGRGTVHIENCTLSIIGGVQPSRIAPLVRGAMSGSSDDGLIQRLQLAVWPDAVGGWKWIDRRPNEAARERYVGSFNAIHEFTARLTAPAVFSFSDDAQQLFRKWMTDLQTSARSGGHPSALESHMLKMPKTIASLALLFELVDGGRGTVGVAAAARAFGWADYLQTHAVRLYMSGSILAENGARIIFARRDRLPTQFTGRDVHIKGWAGLADRDAVSAAIDTLVTAGYCREVAAAPCVSGGRPTASYVWNPHIRDEENKP